MINHHIFDGCGLTIERSDGQRILWDDFWTHNYDDYLFYWVRCEEKPDHILKQENTIGRVI